MVVVGMLVLKEVMVMDEGGLVWIWREIVDAKLGVDERR